MPRRSGEIVREHIVQLDPDKLLRHFTMSSISLHLFDDVHLKALQKEKQEVSSGFLLWTGQIEGVEGGKLILVVRDGLLFASAYLPSSLIQIRPLQAMAGEDSRDYIIRELAYSVGSGSTARETGLTADAMRMIELVNIERKADGLRVLAYSAKLTQAARRHALDMAEHDICSHELSDGEDFSQNVFACGYPVCELGENLASGFATPEEAFECMFSSPEHRQAIMNPDYTQTGASVAVNTASTYRFFWAQEFGASAENSDRHENLSSDRRPPSVYYSPR